MTPPPIPAFELQEVDYAYQDIPALRGLSLSIPAGQRIALLGANGSGKSTLLRLLDALYFPDRGRICAFGQTLNEEKMGHEATALAFRRRVGLVFQNPDVQLFNPTVFDELAFGPLQLGWSREKTLQRIDQTLTDFKLEALRHRPPHRLSGGEKKRLALASVLITEPEVLLLDEPTAALDPGSRQEVVRFLNACQDTGRTLITATHDLDIVEAIADYCLVLQGGRLLAAGPPVEILGNLELLKASQLLRTHWHVHPAGHVHAHYHLHGAGNGETTSR